MDKPPPLAILVAAVLGIAAGIVIGILVTASQVGPVATAPNVAPQGVVHEKEKDGPPGPVRQAAAD
jgi:hypothetical protein